MRQKYKHFTACFYTGGLNYKIQSQIHIADPSLPQLRNITLETLRTSKSVLFILSSVAPNHFLFNLRIIFT